VKLRRLLYGLYAVLRLYYAQEEEAAFTIIPELTTHTLQLWPCLQAVLVVGAVHGEAPRGCRSRLGGVDTPPTTRRQKRFSNEATHPLTWGFG
jgi:hypothetical protein